MLFPNGEKPVTITLYRDCPFDNKYTDHFFKIGANIADANGGTYSPSISMKTFLSTKKNTVDMYPHVSLTGNYNFNYGNGLITSVVLEVSSDYTDANYMLVETGTSGEEKYFFITNALISNASSSGVTVRFDLELDVIATYGYKVVDDLSKNEIPVLTERKHCQRYAYKMTDIGGGDYECESTTKPYCCDLVSDEPINDNIKPTLVKDIIRYKNIVKKYVSSVESDDDSISDVLWAYVTFTGSLQSVNYSDEKYALLFRGSTGSTGVTADNNNVPAIGRVACIPLVYKLILNVKTLTTPEVVTTYTIYPYDVLSKIYDDASVQDIRISPYSPFSYYDTAYKENISFDSETQILTISAGAYTWSTSQTTIPAFRIGDTYFSNDTTGLNKGNLIIVHDVLFPHFSNVKSLFTYPNEINEHALRKYENEPKCLMPPYMKYVIKSQYTDGVEIYPQLQLAYSTTNGNQFLGSFNTQIKTYTVPYSLDTAISTFLEYDATYNVSEKYASINYGLVSSPNYTLPTGSDALKNFNETQKNQFVTGKIAQGVKSAVSTLLGVGAIALGHPLMGVGMIASGGIGGGTAIADSVSKIADLKNTPDSISTMGSNYWHDACVDWSSKLKPYIVVYECTPMEKEMFLDFFYDYGYKVQRCCYFNNQINLLPFSYDGMEMYYKDKEWVDTRLFTRRTFNYIKLGEDISNKIRSVPPIVKKKISNIFQNGIKLWTFFLEPSITSTLIEDYLFKNTYENREI